MVRIVGGALSLLLFCSACSNKAPAKPPAQAVPVSAAKAVEKAVPVELRAIGNVQAYSTVSVKTQVSAEIIKVHFTEGQDVKAGAILFTLDPRSYEAAIRQAEANMERDSAQIRQARANLERDDAQVRQARANLERDKGLVRQARANLERDMGLVRQARDNLERDGAQVRQAKANLERSTAQAVNAESDAQRYQKLVDRNVVSRSQYDQYRTQAEALGAGVRADRAAIENAEASVKASTTAVQNAEATVRASTAAVENAEATVRASTAAVENAEATVRASTAAVENAEAAVRADRAAVENAKVQLSYCTLSSPIDGRTGNLMIQQGNVVKANDIPLVVINQVTPIYVSFSVPEQYLPEIRKYRDAGTLKVEARLPGGEDRPETGSISFIDNAVDTATGMIRLKGTFTNTSRRLWPGQFVNVVLTLTTLAGAVVVPTQAVQTGQQGQYLFVIKPDLTVEARPVTAGRTLAGETVIDKGLQPGEQVVTDGQLRLSPGSKVEVKTPGAGPAAAEKTS
jgi:membrane fusion protein, multidrug efflux system